MLDIAELLAQYLIKKNYKLVTAESCTGGLVAATLTDIAGSSQWFERGFITYSNCAKQEVLGVRTSTLEDYGAVSEETACEMAEGALGNSHAQLSLAVTGIAGPSGGTREKPVGMVCFAWAQLGQSTQCATEYFSGDRATIREQATRYVLEELLKQLRTK